MTRRNPTRSTRSNQTPPAGKAPEIEKPGTAGTESEPPPSPVTFAICWPGPTHLTDEEIIAQKQELEEQLRLCPPLPEEMSDSAPADLEVMEEYAGRLPHRCPDGPKDFEWEAWFDLIGMYLNPSMINAILADDSFRKGILPSPCYWGDEMAVLGY
jgi:hypothetical protein